jgi:ferredoxin
MNDEYRSPTAASAAFIRHSGFVIFSSFVMRHLTFGAGLETHRVTFVTPEREVTVDAAEDEYLLDTATRAGLNLPYSCLQGWCTTCAGKLLVGRVDQSEALRVYPEDQAAGYVLLCSAFARSDARIQTHQKEPMREHRRACGLPTPRG